jgi:hypothetical protein
LTGRQEPVSEKNLAKIQSLARLKNVLFWKRLGQVSEGVSKLGEFDWTHDALNIAHERERSQKDCAHKG